MNKVDTLYKERIRFSIFFRRWKAGVRAGKLEEKEADLPIILQRVVAGGPATCVYFPQLRFLVCASALTIAAAGMETAAPGRIQRAGNVAVQDNPPTPFFAIGNRDGRNQGLGIWMQGLQKKFTAASQFDNFTQVHDGHAITDVTNDAQIMGYEQVGQIEL